MEMEAVAAVTRKGLETLEFLSLSSLLNDVILILNLILTMLSFSESP